MKYALAILLFFSIVQTHADDLNQCLCGPYRHEFEFEGNSTNHYRLMDGRINAALVRDTERTAERKYVMTELLLEWPGRKSGYIPAFDQLAEDGARICVQGKVATASVVNIDGESESLTYFENVDNIFPESSRCRGEPIRIHIDSVRKAELPR